MAAEEPRMPDARGRPAPGLVPEVARYLVSGAGSFATDFSVYGALTLGCGIDPLIAHLVSRPAGALTCFFLNRSWTFRSSGPVGLEMARFWCVFGASLALTEGLLALFCKILGLGPVAGKLVAEAIAVAFNFVALRNFAFQRAGAPAAPAGARGSTAGADRAGMPRVAPLVSVVVGLSTLPVFGESFEVARGLDYARHEADGNVAHVVKMDLRSSDLHIRSVKARGRETIRQLAQRLDIGDNAVMAAINGDFFRQNTAAGLPYGVQVVDGRLLFAPLRRSMIGFGPKNEPYIGVVSLAAKLAFASRSRAKWTAIDDVNPMEAEIAGKNGIFLYTPAFLALDLMRPNGLIVVVEAIDPALQVGDVCEGKVARIETSDKPVSVPESGCLLYFAGDASRALTKSVKPGSPVSLKLELPPIVGGVSQAIGGGPRLVRDGVASVEISKEAFDGVHAMEISKRHPRSAIGFDRARRFLFLVMVEGRHEKSRGMTFGELAAFLVKLGCHQAMAFDGGGSAGMYLQGRGLISMSMGGNNQPEEREVANGLLITASRRAIRASAAKTAKKTPAKEPPKEPAGAKEPAGPGAAKAPADDEEPDVYRPKITGDDPDKDKEL